MKNRDKAIVKDLQRFRCMSRDDIIDLHFQGRKKAVTCCNAVMKRLRRDGSVDANVSQQPYIYFPQPSTIRKTSQKIPHFLAIVDRILYFYEKRRLSPYGKYIRLHVCFTVFWLNFEYFRLFVLKKLLIYVYSKKVMQEKVNRYECYFHSLEWQQEPWQPKKSKYFPSLLIVTDTQYDIYTPNFRIFQTKSIHDFMNQMAIRN